MMFKVSPLEIYKIMPRRTSQSPIRSPIVSKPTISSPPVTYTPQGPTFGQSIKDGFGFGLGSAIAHRIIGPAPVVVQAPATTTQSSEYERCMKESFNDAELCKQAKLDYPHTSTPYCTTNRI
jgi:hypothetical protein